MKIFLALAVILCAAVSSTSAQSYRAEVYASTEIVGDSVAITFEVIENGNELVLTYYVAGGKTPENESLKIQQDTVLAVSDNHTFKVLMPMPVSVGPDDELSVSVVLIDNETGDLLYHGPVRPIP